MDCYGLFLPVYHSSFFLDQKCFFFQDFGNLKTTGSSVCFAWLKSDDSNVLLSAVAVPFIGYI